MRCRTAGNQCSGHLVGIVIQFGLPGANLFASQNPARHYDACQEQTLRPVPAATNPLRTAAALETCQDRIAAILVGTEHRPVGPLSWATGWKGDHYGRTSTAGPETEKAAPPQPVSTPSIIAAMLRASPKISDLIFSPGRAPQIEANGQLVQLNIPGVGLLNSEDTARIAADLIGRNAHAVDKLKQKGRAIFPTVCRKSRAFE